MTNFNSHGTPEDEEKEHFKISKTLENGIIVQIGALIGKTSRILLTANPTNRLYDIDPIVPDSMNINLIGSYSALKSLESEFSNYTFVNDYSYNSTDKISEKIDYLFIDGSHHYEDVKQDFDMWFPKVNVGGIISIHDSAMYRGGPDFHVGPSKYVDDVLLNDSRLIYVDTIFCMTIFRKKED
jgi:hypothetical protein